MNLFNNKYWNIANFVMSILIMLVLNRFLGFNKVRSSYELMVNFSRQLLLFSGFNLISGNLIYFVNNNDKSIKDFRQLYFFNLIVVFIISGLVFFISVFFNLFSKEINYAILLANFILAVDFVGFFAVALGNVYVQYHLQFALKIGNLAAIFFIALFDFDISLIILTSSISLLYIYYVAIKIKLSPLKFQSVKPLLALLKKIVVFSLPWFLASPILNFFSTFVWLNLEKMESAAVAYYSILLFASSSLGILLINPIVDKYTYHVRATLSTRKEELTLFIMTLAMVFFSLLLKLPYLLNNKYFIYLLTQLLFFDKTFISSYLYYIPVYVAFSCPILLVTRIVHINGRQNSFAILSFLVALLQMLFVYIHKDFSISEFIKFSLMTSFVTYTIVCVYNYKIVSKLQFAFFSMMYIFTFFFVIPSLT